jgi:hypothetical protein
MVNPPPPPPRNQYSDKLVGLKWSNDPESYAGVSVVTSLPCQTGQRWWLRQKGITWGWGWVWGWQPHPIKICSAEKLPKEEAKVHHGLWCLKKTEYKYTLFHLKTVLFISTNSTCSLSTVGQGPEQHTMWVHGDANMNFHARSIPSPDEEGQFHAPTALSPSPTAQWIWDWVATTVQQSH